MNYLTIKKFYRSKEWEVFRQRIIIERGTRCEECHKTIIESRHMQVHHTPIELTDENFNDVSISLNPNNVKIFCHRCHNKAHDRYNGASNFIKREKGVYIVYGPPMSGKSSYVLEHMEDGDIVVDMDRLYQAISLKPMYDKPDGLKYIVFGIRSALLDNIKTRYGSWNTAWIIGGYADKYSREKLAKDLGAGLILIDCCKEDCIYRLSYCNDYRQEQKEEWTQYINNWFDNYTK